MVLVALQTATALAHDDIGEYRECRQCGMDRKAYGYSRMLVVYEDGSRAGVCSLHCAAIEIGEHTDKKVKSLWVADRDTHLLIDAKTAYWVIGGRKRGVMTPIAKWAFADKKAAAAFIKENGGTLATFDVALKAAVEENTSTKEHTGHMH
jgi:nitrous oxide reductase accessory protein NosL